MKKSIKTIAETVQNLSSNEFIKVFNQLRKVDMLSYQDAKQENTNHAREFLECYLYSNMLSSVISSFTFDNIKDATGMLYTLTYILGVKSYKLESDKKNFIIDSIELSKPYGNYKTSLENYGLSFPEEKNEVNEVAKTAEQLEALEEANSILASVGLKQVAFDLN